MKKHPHQQLGVVAIEKGAFGSPSTKVDFSNQKENSEFKPIKLHLKIDFESHPAHGAGLNKYNFFSMEFGKG